MDKQKVMLKKAQQAQFIYEDLRKRLGIQTIPAEFVADSSREKLFIDATQSKIPFPDKVKPVVTELSAASIKKIFKEEKIPQTGAIAAVLSVCSSLATQIGKLRGDELVDAKTISDIAFSGLQAIRLYVMYYDGAAFQRSRLNSMLAVNDAFNGVFHKYETADHRKISFHVYYMDQKIKLAKALGLKKKGEDFTFLTLEEDMKLLADRVSKSNALELEELAFECGACASVLRTREEWEAMDVGKAVVNMPLVKLEKVDDGEIPKLGKPSKEGPLSGLKVLDLTHIIAGPVCTRILAEYGADVLLVRRGKFVEQEQAMTELDGWAGKNSIQLDFNNADELARCKELIKEADVFVSSYQHGALDQFGLSEEDIHELNPDIIYSSLNCFSDSVWIDRPGWAPCAEDITGLSVRNGTLEKPVNLNGVPLDYFPGMILTMGTLQAIKKKLEQGGSYSVYTSLCRGAQYLHECADIFEKKLPEAGEDTKIVEKADVDTWDEFFQCAGPCAANEHVCFPGPGVVSTKYPFRKESQIFTDGNKDFKS